MKLPLTTPLKMAPVPPAITSHFALVHYLQHLSPSVSLVTNSTGTKVPQKQGPVSRAQCYTERCRCMTINICWMSKKVNFTLNKHEVVCSGREIKNTCEKYDRWKDILKITGKALT